MQEPMEILNMSQAIVFISNVYAKDDGEATKEQKFKKFQ